LKKIQFKTVFHTVIFAYVYLLIALLIPTNFAVLTPYKTREASTMIQIEGRNLSPNFHTVSVVSMERITGFQRIIYQMVDKFDVYPMSFYDQQTNFLGDLERGQIQKRAAFEQSLISGYQLASEVDPTITINYEFVGMIVDYRLQKHNMLHIGDIILDVNHQGFNAYEAMGLYFLDQIGETVITVNRKGEVFDITLNLDSTDVFQFYPKYEIIDTNPKYTLPGQYVLSSGPSGGAMYTLSIYFALVGNLEINEVIVGTGTIRYNNSVGLIGGLRQKVYAAISEGHNHFILPFNQFDEVEDLSHLIHLYPVKTIDEAIEVVYEIFS